MEIIWTFNISCLYEDEPREKKHTEAVKPKCITGKSLPIKLKLSDKLKELGYDLQMISTINQLRATGIYGNANYKDFPIKRVMRWFSSVIGTILSTKDEVQCYCRPDKKQVIVGLNDMRKIKQELNSETSLVNKKKFPKLGVPTISYAEKNSPVSKERFVRHKQNITDWRKKIPHNVREYDIIEGIFSDYEFVIAPVPDKARIAALISVNTNDISNDLGTLHAEIKILWNIRIEENNASITLDHTKIGGVRVMCAACFAATNGPQQLASPDIISKKDYMKIIRYGPIWPSMSALRSHFLRRSQRNVLEAFSNLMGAELPAPLKTLLNFDETSLTLAHRVKDDKLIFTATHAHDCDSEDSEEDDVNPASKMEE